MFSRSKMDYSLANVKEFETIKRPLWPEIYSVGQIQTNVLMMKHQNESKK